jgi:hypothetical protein
MAEALESGSKLRALQPLREVRWGATALPPKDGRTLREGGPEEFGSYDGPKYFKALVGFSRL